MAADLGTGTTITFGTSSFSAEVLEIGGPSLSRGAVDTTYLGSSAARSFMVTDLYDGGEVTMTIHHTSTTDPPIDAAAETITIVWGGTANTSWSFSGFMTGYEPQASLEDKMTASITIKVAGAVSIDVTP